jgi:hypothetical protein
VVIVHVPANFIIQYTDQYTNQYTGHISDQASPLAKLMPQALAPAQ